MVYTSQQLLRMKKIFHKFEEHGIVKDLPASDRLHVLDEYQKMDIALSV